MDTAPFRALLEEEKARLEETMGSVGRRNPAVPNDFEPMPSETGAEPDLVDQADVTIGQESNAALLADLEAQYDLVLAALGRIDAGTYGVCTVSGELIEEERLRANPAATTCIAHAS